MFDETEEIESHERTRVCVEQQGLFAARSAIVVKIRKIGEETSSGRHSCLDFIEY